VAPDATATAQRDVVMKAVYQTIRADESGDAANLTWIRDFYRDVYRAVAPPAGTETSGVTLDTIQVGAVIGAA
jgi:hypothetical protein